MAVLHAAHGRFGRRPERRRIRPTLSGFPHDGLGRLVGAQTNVGGMPNLSVRRPLRELDLGDDAGLDPPFAANHPLGPPTGLRYTLSEGSSRHLVLCKFQLQVSGFFGAPTSPYASYRQQLAAGCMHTQEQASNLRRTV